MNRCVLPSAASFQEQAAQPIDRPQRASITCPVVQMPLFALSAAALLNPYWASDLAAAQPLQPGSYWGGGSRYILIARQGHDRFCYQGAQPGRLVVASLAPASQAAFYTIYGMNRLAIVQRDRQTLLLGMLTNQKTALLNPLTYRMSEFEVPSTALKECLNTRQPFYKTVVATPAMRD